MYGEISFVIGQRYWDNSAGLYVIQFLTPPPGESKGLEMRKEIKAEKKEKNGEYITFGSIKS